MAYAKVGTDGLAVPAKSLYLRRLAVGVDNNPQLPDPTPDSTALIAQADLLDASYNEALTARLASKTCTAAMDEQGATADLMVARLASYVDGASNGVAAIIEGAGFETRSTPTPVGELPAPTDVQVAPSKRAGSADVKWKPVRGAVAYTIERAEDGAALEWKVVSNGTKKQASVNSMVSGKKYWFRIAAIGAAGQSAWSDPVPLFAP